MGKVISYCESWSTRGWSSLQSLQELLRLASSKAQRTVQSTDRMDQGIEANTEIHV